ncbi:MAG: gluconate 2-dehydrogenase subunit 3 family protein [Bryobacteraceae bacterium]
MMKRRTVFKSLALVPAVAAQTPPASNAPAADDVFKIDLTTADAVADPRHKFFTPRQYATLAKLCDLLGPAYNGRPSAKQAETPQFLDFLLAQSPAERQVLYVQGLDQLEIDARLKRAKSFADLSDGEAGELLAPLQAKWTWKAPAEPLARFLREAKNDVLRATANSKAYADAGAGSRRAAGVNTYWDVID